MIYVLPSRIHKDMRDAVSLAMLLTGRPPGDQSDNYKPPPDPQQPLDAVIIGHFYPGRQFGHSTISVY